MKSKLLVSIFALALAAPSFAKTMTKTHMGSAEWTLNVKKKNGSVKLYTNGTRIEAHFDMTFDEFKLADRLLGTSGSIEASGEIPLAFEFSDERSQESVQAKIKEVLVLQAEDLPIESVEAGETRLSDVFCVESGFFKKVLTCSARFEHEQIITLK